MPYDVQPVSAPRMTGLTLRLFTRLTERPLIGRAIRTHLKSQIGISRLRTVPIHAEVPADLKLRRRLEDVAGTPLESDHPVRVSNEAASFRGGPHAEGFQFTSIADYALAYREGEATPFEVAQRILDATKASEAGDPAMRIFIAQDDDDILAQARAATERHKRGVPISGFDGVPVAVKDEVDMTPYTTTVGTRFLGRGPASEDATVVTRLRQAGALLIGKANMHELGLGVTGINPHHGAARNPYDTRRVTGGSSSGSAAAVAAGLCPVAIGADGGGSIRIPASLCGVVGLKPTFGRVSEHGAAPLCWSVAHLGPIAATARDAAAAYALMAGPDPADRQTSRQPPMHLSGFEREDLTGVHLGIYRPWFEHADPAVVTTCKEAVRRLQSLGATLVEVEIPELELVRLAHLVIIATEMASARLQDSASARAQYGYDVRLNFALAGDITAAEYIQARRLRARLCRQIEDVLDTVDAIVTPTTGCTAPIIAPDALVSGESNLPLLDKIMRFAPLPNLTGHPAVTFPVGYDGDRMPIGLQAIGRAWQESLLLTIARMGESGFVRHAPARHFPLL
jgi:Asp-tRNA(Asn)/Glu-tRNA(Gln) amidotransferase A subunit family amidase